MLQPFAKPGPHKTSEVRANALESAIYFALLDHYEKPPATLQGFFNNHKINIKHSSSQLDSTRKALYLQFPTMPQSFFSKYRLRAHISVDKCFYEGTGGRIDPNRLKWHFCHYTEEYWDLNVKPMRKAYTLHVYYNSLGQAIQFTITNHGSGSTSQLMHADLAIIDTNISIASTVIEELFSFTENCCSLACTQQNILFDKITAVTQQLLTVQDANLIPILRDLQQQYESSKTLSNRYSNTWLNFANVDVEAAIAKLQNVQLDQTPQAIEHKSVPDITVRTEPERDYKQAYLNHIETMTTIMQEAAQIFQNCETFYPEKRIDELKDKLLEIMDDFSDFITHKDVAVRNLAQSTLPTLKSIIEIITTLALANPVEKFLDPLIVNVAYLQRNFTTIESYIGRQFCINIIALFSINSHSNRQRAIDICDFLGSNSHFYIKFIRSMNKLSKGETTSYAFMLLKKCIVLDQERAFRMFLRQGIDLGATSGANSNHTVTLFSNILQFLTEILSDGRSIHNSSIATRYLRIMYEPEFKPDLNEDKITNHMERWAFAQTNVDDNSTSISRDIRQSFYMSPLEFLVIRCNFPNALIEIVANNTQPKEVTLRGLLLCAGVFITKYWPVPIQLESSGETLINFKFKPELTASQTIHGKIAQRMLLLLTECIQRSTIKILDEMENYIIQIGQFPSQAPQRSGYTLGALIVLLNYVASKKDEIRYQQIIFRALVQLGDETKQHEYYQIAGKKLRHANSNQDLQRALSTAINTKQLTEVNKYAKVDATSKSVVRPSLS